MPGSYCAGPAGAQLLHLHRGGGGDQGGAASRCPPDARRYARPAARCTARPQGHVLPGRGGFHRRVGNPADIRSWLYRDGDATSFRRRRALPRRSQHVGICQRAGRAQYSLRRLPESLESAACAWWLVVGFRVGCRGKAGLSVRWGRIPADRSGFRPRFAAWSA